MIQSGGMSCIIKRKYLNDTYSRARIGGHLSDMFPIGIGLKKQMLYVNQDGLKLNSTHQLLLYADDVNIMGGSVPTIKNK